MEIKIKELYGYELCYDERSRRFVIKDTDGTELGNAPTQDEAESKAKALTKAEFKRIRVVRVQSDGRVTMGELTSVNKDDKEAWVVLEKGEDTWGSGREKIHLAHTTGYFEATAKNMTVLENIKKRREIINQTLNEIKSLIETLESPINLGYFGINVKESETTNY